MTPRRKKNKKKTKAKAKATNKTSLVHGKRLDPGSGRTAPAIDKELTPEDVGPVEHSEEPTPGIAEPRKQPGPVVVGIGASAGGLEALSALLSHLPHDTNMAFVVVQHLAPGHDSLMTDLLARKTGMEVLQASDGMRLEPNSVYVIPPDYDLGLLHGTLQLFHRRDKQRPHLPVDHFFRALAQDQGNNAIGVVLSGSGSDGALGLVAIKAEGGITFAQEPKTAQYDNMPRAAIAQDCVDFVQSPEGIAHELIRIAKHPYLRRRPAEEHIADAALDKVFFMLRRATKHDFTNYKRSTIARRVHRRLVLHKLERIEEYVRYLEESPAEVDELFHDLLINVTSFFRDPDVYEAIKSTVFPRLLEGRKPEDPLRIWVPGCSTGEEAYSIAIALIEYLGRESTRAIQIFASDIDDKAIEKARAGFYPESIQAHVSEERLRRFFTAKANGYQINKAIRDLCVLSIHDVVQDPPFSRIDLVCCRNVLIYLDPTLQRKVLARFHFALKPDGFLVLGTSESIRGSEDLYSLVDKKNKIYSKKSVHVQLQDLGGARMAHTAEIVPPLPRPVHMARNVQQETEQLILRNYGPPTVIINEGMEIVGFSGETGPYIEPAPGAISLKLLKMVRPDLGATVRTAVLRAIKQKAQARENNVVFRGAGRERYVNIAVTPLQGPSTGERYYAVIFEPSGKPAAVVAKAPRAEKIGAKDRRLRELTNELEATRNQMQSLVSDYTTAIEELQTANEEIQSSAEEMQSTNEELESAKEELQSTNEELSTLNDELDGRNRELTQVNSDLASLLASVNLPIVMLTEDLRIRRFTPGAKQLLNFIDADIGRPISDIKPNIEIPEFPQVVTEVIQSVAGRTLEARDHNDNWYSVQIRPYRAADGRIGGAVVACIDITEMRRALEQERRLAAVVRDSNDAVLVQGMNGEIRAWNPSAERVYGYRDAEALRMNIHQLIPNDAQGAHDEMIQQLVRGEPVAPLKSVRIAKDGRTVPVLVTASLLVDETGKPTGIATTEREIREKPIGA